MTELKVPKKPVPNWELIRDEWIVEIEKLIAQVEDWCKAKDWPTRRINKHVTEPGIGEYDVPALLIQVDLLKLMIEPVARFAAGNDGLAEMYLMPEYDDFARLYFRSGIWHVQYHVSGDRVPSKYRNEMPHVLAMSLEDRFDFEVFSKVVSLMT